MKRKTTRGLAGVLMAALLLQFMPAARADMVQTPATIDVKPHIMTSGDVLEAGSNFDDQQPDRLPYNGSQTTPYQVQYDCKLDMAQLWAAYNSMRAQYANGWRNVQLSGNFTVTAYCSNKLTIHADLMDKAHITAQLENDPRSGVLFSRVFTVSDFRIHGSTIMIFLDIRKGLTGQELADALAASAQTDIYMKLPEGALTLEPTAYVENEEVISSIAFASSGISLTHPTFGTATITINAQNPVASDTFRMESKIAAQPLLDLALHTASSWTPDFRTAYDVENSESINLNNAQTAGLPYFDVALDTAPIVAMTNERMQAGKLNGTTTLQGTLTLSCTYDSATLRPTGDISASAIQTLWAQKAGNWSNICRVIESRWENGGIQVVFQLQSGVTVDDFLRAAAQTPVIQLALPDRLQILESSASAVWLTQGSVKGTVSYTSPEDQAVSVALQSTTKDAADKQTKNPTPTLAAGKIAIAKTSIPDKTTYTLTFVTNGGSEIAKLDQSAGTTVDLSKYQPTKEDNTFEGWYSDAALTKKVTSITMTDNQTVYAKWNAEEPNLFAINHYAYMIGYPNGEVGPENSVTRAEAATIFLRLLNNNARAKYWKQTNGFHDVVLTNWFNNAVSTIAYAGVLNGYPNGSFLPDGVITRAELAKIIVSFTVSNPNDSGTDKFYDISGHWAAKYINVAVEKGYLTGYSDGSFRPDQRITRAETAVMINRFLGRHTIAPEHMLPGMKTWTDNFIGAWYYAEMQEATNTHTYRMQDAVEVWNEIIASPDWTKLEHATSNPTDISVD